MSLHLFKRKFAAVAAFSLSLMAFNTYADTPLPKPMGFSQVLTFMGSGVINITKSEPFPRVTGCLGTLCTSDYFYTHIMGFNEQQVAQKREDVIAYFNQEFGIDVKTLVVQKRIELKPYTGNPDGEYRLYSVARMDLPTAGWIVRDGGFYITVLDNGGIPLQGYVSYEFKLNGDKTVLTNGREVMTFAKYPAKRDFPDYPSFAMKGDAYPR